MVALVLGGRHVADDAVQVLLNHKVIDGFSPSTVLGIHATLRRALTQAEQWGLVSGNVAKLVSPPQVQGPEVRPFTLEQARAFLDAVRGDRFEVLYELALALGLRQGEALGLTWDYVDLDATRSQFTRRFSATTASTI